VTAVAGRVQPHVGQPFRVGHDVEPAVLADHHELAGDALLQLVLRAVAPAHLLVRDELERERVRQGGRGLPERERLRQRRDLHVLGAARVQPVALPPRPELAWRGRHHVEVGVEHHLEVAPPGSMVDQRGRHAARLEPLHLEARPDEVDDELDRPLQLFRPISGRGHGEQLVGRGEKTIKLHPTILPSSGRSSLATALGPAQSGLVAPRPAPG
jgi:hypothetical protein